MKKRKKYSKEFKLDAVRLVTEQGYSIAEAARTLGLNAIMLGRWKIEAAELEEAALLRRKITDAGVATICTLAMVTSFVKVWADCPLASSFDADALRKHPDSTLLS